MHASSRFVRERKSTMENKSKEILHRKANILNNVLPHFGNNIESDVDKMQRLNTTCSSTKMGAIQSQSMSIFNSLKKVPHQLMLGGGINAVEVNLTIDICVIMCGLCQDQLSDFSFCYCDSGLLLHFGAIFVSLGIVSMLSHSVLPSLCLISSCYSVFHQLPPHHWGD